MAREFATSTIDGMRRLADPGVAYSLHQDKRAQGAKEQPAMNYGAIDLHTKDSQLGLPGVHPTGRKARLCVPAIFVGRFRAQLLGQNVPYKSGIIVCMKKTLHIDERLLREAKSASGAKTDTDTVRLGLEALVRHAAYQRLLALRGSEPRARDVLRRRERPSSAKHSAA